jgi:hypothetical protein
LEQLWRLLQLLALDQRLELLQNNKTKSIFNCILFLTAHLIEQLIKNTLKLSKKSTSIGKTNFS